MLCKCEDIILAQPSLPRFAPTASTAAAAATASCHANAACFGAGRGRCGINNAISQFRGSRPRVMLREIGSKW